MQLKCELALKTIAQLDETSQYFYEKYELFTESEFDLNEGPNETTFEEVKSAYDTLIETRKQIYDLF